MLFGLLHGERDRYVHPAYQLKQLRQAVEWAGLLATGEKPYVLMVRPTPRAPLGRWFAPELVLGTQWDVDTGGKSAVLQTGRSSAMRQPETNPFAENLGGGAKEAGEGRTAHE